VGGVDAPDLKKILDHEPNRHAKHDPNGLLEINLE